MASIRQRGAALLETHPYGYVIGTWLVTATDLFLPHETDYYAFPLLAAGRPKGLFLDLGANLGHSARGFAKLVPGWDILSIEPNPLHETRLRKLSSRDPHFQYRVAAVDAVSGNTCELFVPLYRNTPLHSAAALTLSEAKSGIEKAFPRHAPFVDYVAVRSTTVTIDDLGVSPQIIKFDIQGKELDALKGAERTLATASPDLLVELLSSEDAVMGHLEARDYRPFSYDHATGRFATYDRKSSSSRNVFFSRRELAGSNR